MAGSCAGRFLATVSVLVLSLSGPVVAEDWYDRPVLGLELGPIPPRDRKITKTSALFPLKGAWVLSVGAESPAAKFGIKPEYAVVQIGEDVIDNAAQAKASLAKLKAGDPVVVAYLRPGILAARKQWRDRVEANLKPIAYGEWCVRLHNKTENPTREGWAQYHHIVDIDDSELNGVTVSPFWNANVNGEMDWNIQLGWKGKDWLFIRSAEVKIGDTVIKRDFKLGDVKQNVRVGAGVEETVTVYLTDEEVKAISQLETETGKVGVSLNGKESRASASLQGFNYLVMRDVAAAALWHQRNAASKAK